MLSIIISSNEKLRGHIIWKVLVKVKVNKLFSQVYSTVHQKMEQGHTFTKRGGTTNTGLEYEVLGIANIVINLINDDKITDFHISTNDEDFGAFDDIVVQTEKGNCSELHAIQLKHASKGFLYVTNLQKSDNFSIKKYFESVQTIKRDAHTKFMLCTNLKFKFKKNTKFCLIDDDNDGEDFPITVTKINSSNAFKVSEKTDCCYKFSVVKDDTFVNSDKISLYEKFFDNFFLYTDQESSHELKRVITDKFKSSFCGSELECYDYLRFLTEWSSQDGVIEKLDKKWMKLAIALNIFSSRIKPLSFNISHTDTEILRRKILCEAIDSFDVTVFGKESYDEVKVLWVDAKGEVTDVEIFNKFRKKYQLASGSISDITQADSLTLSVLLWTMDKVPLILTQDASVSKALELCVGKKFVLLGEDSSSFQENMTVFKTLSDLKPTTNQFKQLIQTFMCSFQGKRDLSVEDLVRDDDEILEVFKPDDLLEMVRGRCCIGEAKEELTEWYTERWVLKPAIDIQILDNFSSKTVAILDCVPHKSDLKNKLKNHNLIKISGPSKEEKPQSIGDGTNKTTIYFSEKRVEYSEFNEIWNKSQNPKQFHQFRFAEDGNLEWIRGKGDTTEVEKYKSSESFYRVKESDLDSPEFKNTINLLVADRGMGKSELMKSVKMKTFSDCFTVILDHKDIYSFLRTEPGITNCAYALLKFLLDEKYEMLPDRDKTILRIFFKQNKIILLWDALDQLSTEHVNIVGNVIGELSKNFHQWVTTRRHFQKTLERKFNVLSLNLGKLDETEQISYIRNRLSELCKTEKPGTIFENISSRFGPVDHKHVLGIPLELYTLTELFRKNRGKYLDLLNNSFTLTDLYDYLIGEKLNIHYLEKLDTVVSTASKEKQVQQEKNLNLELHTQAGLRLLFPDELLSKMTFYTGDGFEEICNGYLNIGLVTEIADNIPCFVHDSFAEYLVGRYFSKHLHHQEIQREVMSDPNYTNIKFFFDLFCKKQ